MQLFLDFLRQPGMDQGLVGHGFHSGDLFDRLNMKRIQFNCNIFKLAFYFAAENAFPQRILKA